MCAGVHVLAVYSDQTLWRNSHLWSSLCLFTKVSEKLLPTLDVRFALVVVRYSNRISSDISRFIAVSERNLASLYVPLAVVFVAKGIVHTIDRPFHQRSSHWALLPVTLVAPVLCIKRESNRLLIANRCHLCGWQNIKIYPNIQRRLANTLNRWGVTHTNGLWNCCSTDELYNKRL